MVMLIRLTPRQMEIAEWAIDPMDDYFREQFESGEIHYFPQMPTIRKDVDALDIPADGYVIGDLLYRLLYLFQDICNGEQSGFVATHILGEDGVLRRNVEGERKRRGEIVKARGDAASARGLARKIEKLAKSKHIDYVIC